LLADTLGVHVQDIPVANDGLAVGDHRLDGVVAAVLSSSEP